jgi:hypothetical protein
MKCINQKTNKIDDIEEYVNYSHRNIVIDYENKIICYNRELLLSKVSDTVVDNRGVMYYRTNLDVYVCPRDLSSLKDYTYCLYRFDYIKSIGDKKVYNVKSYTLSDYNLHKV